VLGPHHALRVAGGPGGVEDQRIESERERSLML
jgi:hypothetical protein